MMCPQTRKPNGFYVRPFSPQKYRQGTIRRQSCRMVKGVVQDRWIDPSIVTANPNWQNARVSHSHIQGSHIATMWDHFRHRNTGRAPSGVKVVAWWRESSRIVGSIHPLSQPIPIDRTLASHILTFTSHIPGSHIATMWDVVPINSNMAKNGLTLKSSNLKL